MRANQSRLLSWPREGKRVQKISARTLLRFRHNQAYERSEQTARILACQLSLASSFAFRLLFPYGLSRMSCPVFETLADDAFQSKLPSTVLVLMTYSRSPVYRTYSS